MSSDESAPALLFHAGGDLPGGLDEGFDLSELVGEEAAENRVAFGDLGELGPEVCQDTGLDVHDGDVYGI